MVLSFLQYGYGNATYFNEHLKRDILVASLNAEDEENTKEVSLTQPHTLDVKAKVYKPVDWQKQLGGETGETGEHKSENKYQLELEEQPQHLTFSDVWCCVRTKPASNKKNKSDALKKDAESWKWILRGAQGRATLGRSLAILGPSGSGKTTLLSALGKQLEQSPSLWITGEVNGPEHSIAYVPQETPFFSNLTVRETLEFFARLEPSSSESVRERVDKVVRKLGLITCVDTLVGGDTGGHNTRGISGGEKRRLAIACELLRTDCCAERNEVTVLIADEPTTGLDAFQADKVVEQLTEIAHSKDAMVMMCIHQPRSAIYDKLDDILLMAPGGHVCFLGGAKEAVGYFAKLGYKCPENYNPAEFLVDLVSVDTTSERSEKESWKKIKMLYRVWLKESRNKFLPSAAAQPGAVEGSKGKGKNTVAHKARRRGRRVGLFSQFSQLVKRAFTQTRREGYIHLTRAVGTTVLALAFGSCHFKLGLGQKGIKRRGAVMMQVCINSAMMATIKTLNSFPKERTVVRKELSKTRKDGSKLYGIGPYFVSKLLIEAPIDAFFPVLFGSIVGPLSGLNGKMRLPFLGTLALQGISASAVGMSVGALAPNTETALAIGPIVMVLSIMLGDSGGMFAEVPDFLKPAARFSLIKWGFDGCMGSEFTGLDFTCDDLGEMMPKEQASGSKVSLRNRKYEKEVAERVCIRSGAKVLESMNLGKDCVKTAALMQTKLISMNLLITFLLLQFSSNAPLQFSNLDEPPICYPSERRESILIT